MKGSLTMVGMHKAFVKKFIAVVLMSLLFILCLGILVDPFDIVQTPHVKGFNAEKVGFSNQRRFQMALGMMRKKAKVVLLGSSRMMAGMEASDIEALMGETTFNAGFPGADFEEIYAYFLHALHVQPDLKSVIIGIDLFAFNKTAKPKPDFNPSLLQRSSLDLENLLSMFFSTKAILAAFKTIRENYVGEFKKENEVLKLGESTVLNNMLNDKNGYKNYQIGHDKIKKFESLVEICKQRSISLKVFICPLTARYFNFYCQKGLWTSFEDLKRALTAIHPIWDFSGCNPITMETLKTEESLYQDFSHFTPFVGNILVRRMLNIPTIADSVGYLLTPESIEEKLIQIRQGLIL